MVEQETVTPNTGVGRSQRAEHWSPANSATRWKPLLFRLCSVSLRTAKKGTVCPQEAFFSCVRLRAREQFCCLSLQWPSFLRFPIYFLHRKVGGALRGHIANKYISAAHSCEASHALTVCIVVQRRSGAVARFAPCVLWRPAKLKITNRKLKSLCLWTLSVASHTAAGGFNSSRLFCLFGSTRTVQANTRCISIAPRIVQNLNIVIETPKIIIIKKTLKCR